jgi:hypothetical protein
MLSKKRAQESLAFLLSTKHGSQCVPEEREWPDELCQRCKDLTLPCSEPLLATRYAIPNGATRHREVIERKRKAPEMIDGFQSQQQRWQVAAPVNPIPQPTNPGAYNTPTHEDSRTITATLTPQEMAWLQKRHVSSDFQTANIPPNSAPNPAADPVPRWHPSSRPRYLMKSPGSCLFGDSCGCIGCVDHPCGLRILHYITELTLRPITNQPGSSSQSQTKAVPPQTAALLFEPYTLNGTMPGLENERKSAIRLQIQLSAILLQGAHFAAVSFAR